MARIMVAGDDEDLRELFAFCLSRRGHAVHVVHELSEVAGTAATITVDLILLDVRELRQATLALARALRDSPRHRETPILVLSANPSIPVNDQTSSAGIDACLLKPVGLDKLNSMVNDLLK